MALIIPYFIKHYGCPHRCLFCNQEAIAEASATEPNDPAHALPQTITQWLTRSKRHEQVQLAFFGGSFTCLDEVLQKRFLEVAAEFIEQKLIHSIRLSTRPDCLDAELCAFLFSHGVRTVELGVQSMNEHVLARVRRGHTVEDSRKAVRLLQQFGFEVGVQIMVGLPAETTRSFLAGIEEIISLAPDFVRLYPFLVIADTGVAADYQASAWAPLSMHRALTLTRIARERFRAHYIKVVRMGLQPSAHLEQAVLAGPYHPAFGECVIGRSWFLRIRPLVTRTEPGRTLTVTISTKDYSAFVGKNRGNITRLEQISGCRIVVSTDASMTRDTFHHAFS